MTVVLHDGRRIEFGTRLPRVRVATGPAILR